MCKDTNYYRPKYGYLLSKARPTFPLVSGTSCRDYTVRKMNLILCSIEWRPQMQFSMARKFKFRQLRRYFVKPSKMCKYTPHLAKVYAFAARKFTHILHILAWREPVSPRSLALHSTTAPHLNMYKTQNF